MLRTTRTVLPDGPMSDSDQATIVLLLQKSVASSQLLHQMVWYSQLWRMDHVRQVRTLVSLVRQQVTMQDLVEVMQPGHASDLMVDLRQAVVLRMRHVPPRSPALVTTVSQVDVSLEPFLGQTILLHVVQQLPGVVMEAMEEGIQVVQ